MSQSEPNLTVVIPVHNAAPHLGACVESLLAQSYTDFELILVENGSSDDSRERCCPLRRGTPRAASAPDARRSVGLGGPQCGHRQRPRAFHHLHGRRRLGRKGVSGRIFPRSRPGSRERSSCKAYCSTFRRPSRRGRTRRFSATTTGRSPSATILRQPWDSGFCRTDAASANSTTRRRSARLGIRFIEHLCSREDHLFFFTCISRMQSVVWRSGLYMHYMRRGRNTLSTRPMPACELVEAAERLDRFIPPVGRTLRHHGQDIPLRPAAESGPRHAATGRKQHPFRRPPERPRSHCRPPGAVRRRDLRAPLASAAETPAARPHSEGKGVSHAPLSPNRAAQVVAAPARTF